MTTIASGPNGQEDQVPGTGQSPLRKRAAGELHWIVEQIARDGPHGEKTQSDGACKATYIVRRQSLLVLTRKLDQSIVVSFEEAEVIFKIIRCGRDKVSVGIEAPPRVKILRAELQAGRPAA